VTRLTVREALAQLETAGFVRTLHGSGSYVLDPAESATLELLAQTLSAGRKMRPDEIESLMEFRHVVIIGFAETLARKATPADVKRLEEIIALERAALGNPTELAALDFRFNQVLAAASRNLFYVLLLRSVAEAHLHLGEIVFRSAGDGELVVDTHASIVRALTKGDAASLRRRLETYLGGGQAIVTHYLAGEKS
jgi:DNA-binding FadR family transcriptional regulator